MHKKLIPIAEHLICAVEEQMEDLEGVCTQELGEVIDMIKDLSKAIYYDVVTEAMLEVDELDSSIATNPTTASYTHSEKVGGGYTEYHKYLEAKHNHADNAILMKKLEEFMQAFSSDIMNILSEISPEEKQYLHKKMSILTNKLA